MGAFITSLFWWQRRTIVDEVDQHLASAINAMRDAKTRLENRARVIRREKDDKDDEIRLLIPKKRQMMPPRLRYLLSRRKMYESRAQRMDTLVFTLESNILTIGDAAVLEVVDGALRANVRAGRTVAKRMISVDQLVNDVLDQEQQMSEIVDCPGEQQAIDEQAIDEQLRLFTESLPCVPDDDPVSRPIALLQ